jgi:pimeloyl-ACP methyl ester carboxylesterase
MLAHLRRGEGEPLLLLHGLGGAKEIWTPLLDRLGAEREAIAVDMPGFGESPSLPSDREPNAANLAAAIRGFCEEQNLERPHLAGNSLGGWVALEAGRNGWAASVTAISPAGLWRRPLGPRRIDPHRWARLLRPLVSLALHSSRIRASMLGTSIARPELIPARVGRDLVLGWIDAPGYEAANLAMRTYAFDPAGYPEIPVTLAWGSLDRLIGPPRPERRPPGARFEVLADVGHTPTWDDPELVAATLLAGSSMAVRP